MNKSFDTCITGYGVSCGAEVHLRPDCAIEISGGTLIFPQGQILHLPNDQPKQFRYYIKPEFIEDRIKKFMLEYLKIKKLDDHFMEFLLLAEDKHPNDHTDSLKQQHPEDIPEQNLMGNKIIVVIAFPKEEREIEGHATDQSQDIDTYWLLVSRNALAARFNIGSSTSKDHQGLFSKPLTRKEVDPVTIDEYLRKVLILPQLTVPRFGYKQLAMDLPAKGMRDDNLLNPFRQVTSFSDIFFEYKAIIDDYILQFRDALDILHKNFGAVLSHKGSFYLEKYRKILMLKLKVFYEEGEHLYYIQYIYDWLRDLTIAFNELIVKLDGFTGVCPCFNIESTKEQTGTLLMLGPVMGGRTIYSPSIFRNLAIPADSDRTIRELRCMHWRLLMMIRTFDLPFLHLEKALASFGSELGIEEKLDSTNYWEFVNDMAQNDANDEFNYLPVKFTPTNGSTVKLGKTAIPYYYPLDSNSIYSVHQFWDYETTVLRKTDTHLSYNAYMGDPSKPATDTVNDSYTNRIEVILPLAFNLEPYAAFRPEGFIGKHLTKKDNGVNSFFLRSFPLLEYLIRYNICIDIIAIPLPGGKKSRFLNTLQGLEHRPVMEQGKTLVLFFVDSVNEQIELAECKKDKTPEIADGTVVADFVLPYRFTCCPSNLVIYRPIDIIPVL